MKIRLVLFVVVFVGLELLYELTKVPMILYIYLVLPYLFFFFRKSSKLNGFSNWRFLGILIFLVFNALYSLFQGDCLFDIFGSHLRFLLFPFLLIVFSEIERFNILYLVKSYMVVEVLGKIAIFLINGKIYGGPIYVVDVNPFIVTGMFATNTPLAVLIISGALLGLKRSSWLLISVIVFGLIKNRKSIISISLFSFLLVMVSKDTGNFHKIMARYEYTTRVFNGEKEGSLSKRFDETKAVMGQNRSGIDWLIGTGGGGGYVGEFSNRNLNCRGEYYHIHNMWLLLFHRYGIIGLFMYLFFFLGLLYKILFKSFISFWFSVVLVTLTLTGNVFFGGWWFTLVLFLAVKYGEDLYIPQRILSSK